MYREIIIILNIINSLTQCIFIVKIYAYRNLICFLRHFVEHASHNVACLMHYIYTLTTYALFFYVYNKLLLKKKIFNGLGIIIIFSSISLFFRILFINTLCLKIYIFLFFKIMFVIKA